MYVDISSVNTRSQGGKKYWIVWCDAATKMCFGQFLKEKSDLVDVGIFFVENLRSQYGVKAKTIQCDNAGENIKLKEKLDEL